MQTILIATSSFNSKILSEYIPFFKKKKIKVLLNPYKRTLNQSNLKKIFDKNLIGIVSGNEKISSMILKLSPNLKIISRCGIGSDNIDMDFARKNSIKVTFTYQEPVYATAELTLLHILNAIRKFNFNSDKRNLINWKRKKGNSLEGKKIGIIGYGNVGKKLSNLLKPFRCKIYYYDKIKTKNKNFLKLNQLIKICDIVTLHLPLTNKTRDIIDLKRLNLLKENSIILNIARGGLINESDIFKFLKKRKDIIACFDSYEKEPYKGKLLNLENTILTPHVGSFTKEARDQMEYKAMKNLCKNL